MAARTKSAALQSEARTPKPEGDQILAPRMALPPRCRVLRLATLPARLKVVV